MEEPLKHYYAKWKNPDTKGQILYDPSYMRYLEQIYREWENSGYQVLERGENEDFFNGYKVFVWDDKVFWRWRMIMVAQHCEFT